MDPELYTDDSACTAKLSNLKVWFQKLCELGPDYGYHPEPKKTVLVVRATEEAEAKTLFGELGVKIVRGHRFLGGFIEEVACFCFSEGLNLDIWSGCTG